MLGRRYMLIVQLHSSLLILFSLDDSSLTPSVYTPSRFTISLCSIIFEAPHSDNGYTMLVFFLPIILTLDLCPWILIPLRLLIFVHSLIILSSISITHTLSHCEINCFSINLSMLLTFWTQPIGDSFALSSCQFYLTFYSSRSHFWFILLLAHIT